MAMMNLQQAVTFRTSDRQMVEITACEIMGGRSTLFGYEFTFVFRIEPAEYKENPLTLETFRVEVSLVESETLRIGQLTTRTQSPHLLNHRRKEIQQQLNLRSDELIILADRTHHGDVTLDFSVDARFEGNTSSSESGRLIIPQTEWLKILKGVRVDRYELIVIRTPVAASHLHSPFSEALDKIREAEQELTRETGTARERRAGVRGIR